MCRNCWTKVPAAEHRLRAPGQHAALHGLCRLGLSVCVRVACGSVDKKQGKKGQQGVSVSRRCIISISSRFHGESSPSPVLENEGEGELSEQAHHITVAWGPHVRNCIHKCKSCKSQCLVALNHQGGVPVGGLGATGAGSWARLRPHVRPEQPGGGLEPSPTRAFPVAVQSGIAHRREHVTLGASEQRPAPPAKWGHVQGGLGHSARCPLPGVS